MTYSVLAYAPETNRWGVATASKYLGVGGIVPRVYDKLGGFLTQAQGNHDFHMAALQLLMAGHTADEVITRVLEDDPDADSRQLAVSDAFGNLSAYTGSECSPISGHRTSDNALIIGNLLHDENVLDVMHLTYETHRSLDFEERLLYTLKAGEQAGGDRRGKQSAAIQITKGTGEDEHLDLRVDDHEEPLNELDRLLSLSREYSQRVRISAG